MLTAPAGGLSWLVQSTAQIHPSSVARRHFVFKAGFEARAAGCCALAQAPVSPSTLALSSLLASFLSFILGRFLLFHRYYSPALPLFSLQWLTHSNIRLIKHFPSDSTSSNYHSPCTAFPRVSNSTEVPPGISHWRSAAQPCKASSLLQVWVSCCYLSFFFAFWLTIIFAFVVVSAKAVLREA